MTQEDLLIEQEWNDYMEAVTESGLPLFLCEMYRRNILESQRDEGDGPGFMDSLEDRDSSGSKEDTSSSTDPF